MLDDSVRLEIAGEASFQDLGENEGAVILRTDSGELYTCNDTTAALLRAVDGERSFGAIVDILHQEFDVERQVLAEDLSAIALELEGEGILRRIAVAP
jgi:pyrroloquinoline quinone biosynthesis protein D